MEIDFRVAQIEVIVRIDDVNKKIARWCSTVLWGPLHLPVARRYVCSGDMLPYEPLSAENIDTQWIAEGGSDERSYRSTPA